MTIDTPDTDDIEPTIAQMVREADEPPTTAEVVDAIDASERRVHYALQRLYEAGELGTLATEQWSTDTDAGWIPADHPAAQHTPAENDTELMVEKSDFTTARTFPIDELPTLEATGTVWVAAYRESGDVVATKAATTARAAAYLALDVARTGPASEQTEWEVVGSNTYRLANRGDFDFERYQASIVVGCHDVHRPDDVDALNDESDGDAEGDGE